MVAHFEMNTMCFRGRKGWMFSVLLILHVATYLSMADDFWKVEQLYNESLARWDFEESLNSSSSQLGVMEGFCQIQGIHGTGSFAAELKRTDRDPLKSAKITMSSYGSSNCPTDPLACEKGFTVAFWLSLKPKLADEVDGSTCMLLSLNDTSSKGFQAMLDGPSNNVTFQALGTKMMSSDAFNATNIWIWNHLGLTWDNETSILKMYINGEPADGGEVRPNLMAGDPPLDELGCTYTALDDIAIWSRPLTDDEMLILRLDRFNETEFMTTTQQETTTETTTPITTASATTMKTTSPVTTGEATTMTPTTIPTTESTSVGTTKPTTIPTTESTSEGTTKPTTVPTTESTSEGTTKPTTIPTTESTSKGTMKPTTVPTTESTSEGTASGTTVGTTADVQQTTSRDFILPDAVNKVEGTNKTREIIDTLESVRTYLTDYSNQPDESIDSDRGNIQSILDVMPSKIETLDNSSEAERVLEEYMGIVNDVLTINKEFANESKWLLSGLELALSVDKMLSSYINVVPVIGDEVIQNTFVDTTVAESVSPGSGITMKLLQCRTCSDSEIVVVIPSGVFEDSQTMKQASASTFYDGVKAHLPKSIIGDKKKYDVASFLVGVNLNVPSTSMLSVNITISIGVTKLNNTQEAKCAFLDGTGGWSTSGVSSVTDADSKTVNCTSNHLTNFAVLVSTRELNISQENELALEILTNVGLAISITCLILTVIILNVLRQLSSTRISILKHTAAALLIAQIVFIVGASTLNQVEGVCTALAALLHYFFLAVFCWMLIQGVQLYMKVRRALKGSIDMVYFCVFGWGFPAIIVGISVGVSHTNYNSDSGVCWISVKQGVGTLIAFIGPAYLILAINLVVLCMVMHVFLTVKVNKDKSEMDKLKSGLKAVIVMVPILGVTWFFGLFLIVSPDVVFLYLFVIFNSSQGLLMFLFHVVFNDEVKQALIKKRNKIAASKDSNSVFSKALKSKSGSDQTTTEGIDGIFKSRKSPRPAFRSPVPNRF